MSQFWSPIVHSLTPYVPGEQPKFSNLIKLNTNENPYGPSPKALTAMRGEAIDTLKLYPDPESSELKSALAKYYKVKAANVFVGNGSDEVLAHSFAGLLKQDKPLLFPDISYSFYPVYCALYQIDSLQIPLNEKLEINLDNYPIDNGGIIFPNPNAPTGLLTPLSEIENLLKRNTHSVVVIDEAYIDFGGESAISLVDQYPNLLVIQTFSKSRSLAGLRVGFAIGDAKLIEGLERIKNSFNSYPLDRFAIKGATAAIEDETHFRQCCNNIIKTRQTVCEQLSQLGFSVLPSAANFIFTKHTKLKAINIASSLREKSIIVRHFKQNRIDDYLRITIGTDQECEILIKALKDIVS